VINADIDPASIGGQIVDAVRSDLAQFRIDEVMNPDFFGRALGLPFLACVLEVANQFLLLGIDGNRGVSGGLIFGNCSRDVRKLCVPIFMLPAFPSLAGRLQAVFHLRQ